MPQSKDRHREYMRGWYQDNKKQHQKYVRKAEAVRVARYAQLVEDMKREPCTDCGQTFDPVCMDFDHLGDKEFNVSRAVRNYGWERVLAEIAKCELVCANCHRLRTRQRWLDSHPNDVIWSVVIDAESPNSVMALGS